jgi:hypothetical protein
MWRRELTREGVEPNLGPFYDDVALLWIKKIVQEMKQDEKLVSEKMGQLKDQLIATFPNVVGFDGKPALTHIQIQEYLGKTSLLIHF